MWEQTRRLIGSLTRAQQILIAVVAMAVAGGLYWFQQQHRENDFRPLFTGLAVEDAGQVITKLKEGNVEFRLADNGSSVLVRSAHVAETRLLVAGAGLPKSGRIGFEIFDKTNFGASDFSEQINYRRALEGELERSVMSISEVEQARVHITPAKDSVFTESKQPAKASVLIKLKHDARISPQNVIAIEHLVASAVEGLKPDGVTVVDMQGNLLNKVRTNLDEPGGDGPIEYRQRVEKDLLAKINSTLEPVLGADHFRAGVSVEVDFTSGEQSEETWDPTRSVMGSQQRTEESNSPSAAAGVPGTASNLPRPTSRPGSGSSQVTRRTENVTYQTSRLVRRTKLPQGNLRRVSVSAIIDQKVRWEGTGARAKRILEPPNEETLKKVRELMTGAVGLDEKRGDQITIQTLPFESTLRMPPPPDPVIPKPEVKPPPPAGIDKWLAEKNIKVSPLILLSALGGMIVALIGMSAFLLLRRKRKAAGKATVASRALEAGETGVKKASAAAAEGQLTLEERIERQLTEQAEHRRQTEMEVLNSLKMPDMNTKKAEVLIKHISEQAKRDPAAMAQLIRTWLVERD